MPPRFTRNRRWRKRQAHRSEGDRLPDPAREIRLSHEIHYTFSFEDGREYTRGDFLGRSNLWSVLPEDEWKTVTAAGKLMVRYAPADPSNNAPASYPPKWSDIWTAFGIGLVLLLIFILGIFLPRRHGES